MITWMRFDFINAEGFESPWCVQERLTNRGGSNRRFLPLVNMVFQFTMRLSSSGLSDPITDVRFKGRICLVPSIAIYNLENSFGNGQYRPIIDVMVNFCHIVHVLTTSPQVVRKRRKGFTPEAARLANALSAVI